MFEWDDDEIIEEEFEMTIKKDKIQMRVDFNKSLKFFSQRFNS